MAALLLADNDVLIKAAHWHLLDCVPACAGTTWSGVAVLPSLVHRARKRDRKLFSDPTIAEALERKLQVTSVLPIPDATVVAALQGVTGLDAGEVVLIGCMAANRASFLLTGDKRALRALAATGLTDITQSLAGRVLCLEHVIAYAFATLGATELSRSIEPYRELDTATRVIVPAIANAHHAETRIREALNAYLRDLDNETQGLLWHAWSE